MLRKITDQAGDVWEIARGHESYGAMVILFCRCYAEDAENPQRATEEIRFWHGAD
jgi:hypothetical protein